MKVFSSDNWVEPADAEYKNLCIENFDLDDENSGNLNIKLHTYYILLEGCSQMLIDDGWIPRGRWCYKFYDEKKSWEEANQSCEDKVKQ